MEKEKLKKMLKENLSIEIQESEDMYTRDVEILIHFDGEEIASGSYMIENKN